MRLGCVVVRVRGRGRAGRGRRRLVVAGMAFRRVIVCGVVVAGRRRDAPGLEFFFAALGFGQREGIRWVRGKAREREGG